MQQALQVHWRELIDDLAWMLGEPAVCEATPQMRIPLAMAALAVSIGYPRKTVIGWHDGAQPKHSDGEVLIKRWCELSGKARAFLPM